MHSTKRVRPRRATQNRIAAPSVRRPLRRTAAPRGIGLATATAWSLALCAAAQSPSTVNDRTVNAAVDRGVEWLKSQRNAAGHWEPGEAPDARDWTGSTSLALLALLNAGESAKTDEMNRSLEWLAAQSLRGTYVCALRAQVLALANAPKLRKRLEADLAWLISAAHPAKSEYRGAYDYEAYAGGGARYDNSNSQFGVLGAWMATEAGAKAANLDSFWKLVEDHWLREQNPDGGWGYQKIGDSRSTGSMTAAGLSSLYIILDRVHARSGHRQARRLLGAIDAGLGWLSREYAPDNVHGSRQWRYYYFYGLERAGRASGRKYFRDRDWFRESAAAILADQTAEGMWPGGLHDTCFAVLFLCHGRAPLLLNKLDQGDDWDHYLRDAAGLCRYASDTFEKLFNWQIVSLDGTIDDLLEAPMLYLLGTRGWEFSDADVQRLREYSQRGGLIVAVCPPEAREFRASIESLARKLFPELRPRRLTGRDPLFDGRVQFVIESPPEVLEVHNGIRSLLLLVADDVAAAWNRFDVKNAEVAFQLGCNLHVYATDRSPPPGRLATPSIAIEPVETVRTIRVARIRYKGGWNIEPHGWQRLRAYLNNTGRTNLETTTLSFDSPELAGFKVAHISGTGSFVLGPTEIAGLRRFLTDGGTLLADAAVGAREFTESLERNVGDALKVPPLPLPPSSPIFTARGVPDAIRLDRVDYRRAARGDHRGREFPPLRCFVLGSRPAVIYSPLDISVGLLGTPVYDCRGYDPDGCLVVMRNLLLYSALPTGEKARLDGSR